MEAKDCFYELIDGEIVITCAPFSKYSRKPSDVPPPIKPGSKCPGFLLTLNANEKLKICCLFTQSTRNEENSYWNKKQWLKCNGCQIVYANLVQNPTVSMKRPPRVLEYAVGYLRSNSNCLLFFLLFMFCDDNGYRTTLK
jgi:hypothetical protein